MGIDEFRAKLNVICTAAETAIGGIRASFEAQLSDLATEAGAADQGTQKVMGAVLELRLAEMGDKVGG